MLLRGMGEDKTYQTRGSPRSVAQTNLPNQTILFHIHADSSEVASTSAGIWVKMA